MNLREMADAAELAAQQNSEPLREPRPEIEFTGKFGRNNHLTSFAGSLVKKGLTDHEIEARVQAENSQFPTPLPDHEINALLRQVTRWSERQEVRQPDTGHLVFSDNSVRSQEEFAEIPPFPIESLPSVVRRYCEEAAAAIGVPVEMIACPLLVYAGATVGNQQRIQLKAGFDQYPLLWVTTVAPPGTAKTPADDAARMPINELQSEEKHRFDLAREEYERELHEWNGSPSETRGVPPDPPKLQHFFSTDTTIEAVARILEGSPGIVLARDEFVGWVNSMDAYKAGKGAERQAHLSGWSGVPIKIDRKTSDTIFIDHPVVGICGGIQPDVMGDLSVEAGRRDGFLERILWNVPQTKPAPWSEAEISSEASYALLTLFRHLRHTEASPAPVQLSQGAKQLFTSWYDENQVTTAEIGGLMAGVYAKMPLQLARLTLIFHCMEYPDAPSSRLLPPETMNSAIKVVEYFRGRASLALGLIDAGAPYQGSGKTARVFQILTKADEWCSRSAIHKQLGGHVPADMLTKALAELEQAGLAEQRRPESKVTGGRRGVEWRTTDSERTEQTEQTSWEESK